MKTKLLILLCFAFYDINAQVTHDLNWERFANGPEMDLDINTGDTVKWTWTDAFPHTVTDNVGPEIFSSPTFTGIGMTYSHTYTMEGVNDYFCDIHGAGSMSGTISVTNVLSVDDFAFKGFSISPNPARSSLILKLPNGLNEVFVEVFDVLGKEIFSNKFSQAPINISNWSKGVYLVKVSSGDAVHTKRFIKQ